MKDDLIWTILEEPKPGGPNQNKIIYIWRKSGVYGLKDHHYTYYFF